MCSAVYTASIARHHTAISRRCETTSMTVGGVRVMALATCVSVRCCAFVPGGLHIVRPGVRLAGRLTGLHSSTRLEESNIGVGHSLGRSNADDASMDTSLIVKDPALVLEHLQARRMGEGSVEAVHRIGELMKSRRDLLLRKEKALNERKTLSAEIGKLMKSGQAGEAEAKKKEVENFNKVANSAEEKFNEVDGEVNSLLMTLPNLLDSRVPDGDDEKDNNVVTEWGQEHVKSGQEFIWHDEVATKLGGWDPEGAVRIAGARFAVLKGPLARLERALSQWMLDLHTMDHGYTEVSVPILVTRSSLEGTGQLPKFEEDLFKTNHLVANEDSFLIPTGEVPVTNLLRGELLDGSQLPLSFVALTPCFRAEAGSAGRDTRGLLRQHQFLKVELVKITSQEESCLEHEVLTQHAEAVLKLRVFHPARQARGRLARACLASREAKNAEASLVKSTESSHVFMKGSKGHEHLVREIGASRQCSSSSNLNSAVREPHSSNRAPKYCRHVRRKGLKLPFRRVSLCSGDIGFGARICYDLEVWMPGQDAYREISSCSNCYDFQARRMALRYRQAPPGGKGKSRNVLCHTINGSGVAVGRALVAVLENYYNPSDGSVDVPDVLRPYMGGMEKLVAI